MDQGVERSLGRIEGTQEQILAELKSLRGEFGDHKNEDQVQFSDVRSLVYAQRDQLALQMKASAADVLNRLEKQEVKIASTLVVSNKDRDEKLDQLVAQNNFAKGAGWVIIATVGALGSAVLAVFEGWIKLKS